MPVWMVPQKKGPKIVLDKAITLIGRNPGCDAVITHSKKISRKHCCVAQVNGRYVVRDLGSMNGIWINGERVKGQGDIRVGDEISIGDIPYRLVEQKPPNGQDDSSSRNLKKQRKQSTQAEFVDEPPPLPPDLSQDFPMPIPEESDSFVIEESIHQPANDDPFLDSDSGMLDSSFD